MNISKPHISFWFFHHFILKVTTMINDNLTQDTEPGDNLIEYEEGYILPIGFNCRHGLDPLIKVVDDHNNVLMPPSLQSMKSMPHLVKGLSIITG